MAGQSDQIKVMFKRFAPILLLVSACGPPLQPSPPLVAPPVLTPAAEDTCNAAQYGNLIGQDASALERVLLMGPVRVVRPGMAVTMDYSAARINFSIDAANRINQITCG